MWEYKTSRVNFKVATNEDGAIASTGDTIKGTMNAKIDGIASDASVEQANLLIGTFYTTLAAAAHYDTVTKTLVVSEE